MPIVNLHMTLGRSDEQKQRLIAEITEVVSRVADCPSEAVSVVIDDHYKLSDWGVGGKTWVELLEEQNVR